MASFYEVPVTEGGAVHEWKGRWEEREGLLLRGGELDAGELFQMGSGRGSCLPCGALQGQVDWGQVEGSWWLRPGWSPQGEGGGWLAASGSCTHIFPVFHAVKTGKQMVQVLPKPRAYTPSSDS